MMFFDSILTRIRLFFIGFFVGMKKTEEQVLTQKGTDGSGVGVVKEQDEHRVAQALLKGELTQSVRELRYRTYEVEKESQKVKYITPLAAEHLDENEIYDRNLTYDDTDGRELILIQGNKCYTSDVLDIIESVDEEKIRFNEDGELEYDLKRADIDTKREYTFKVDRDCFPRFMLEEFAKMLVLKEGEDNDHVYIDMYVSMYPDDDNVKSRPFLKELRKVIETNRRSDILDISGISFVTHKAYRKRDMFSYSFDSMEYVGNNLFDGNFVLKYRARYVDRGTDRRELYHDDIMANKYATRQKKDFTANINDYAAQNIVKYKCEECGREVFMNLKDMDHMVSTEPRFVDEDCVSSDSVTEFYDYQIAENTFGKQLCKHCMTKKMKIIVDNFEKNEKRS